ncbi:MAG: DUF1178 family protein [Alphaproteobacteria bacterium]|nr:DUF1178 family protein [Alphaproteobacteria bacterium]
MVVYDVRCSHDHVFEAWFPDSAAFDAQVKKGEVSCPVCGDARVARAPMAPNVATGKGDVARKKQMAAHAVRMLTKMQAFIEKNCDNVGNRFAEEARKIHYGERESRNICGRATEQEANELRDEGIEFGEIPWRHRSDA